MKQTAVVIAPGRGTYNKAELGYLGQHHSTRHALISEMDAYRTAHGQKTVTELDQAARFSGAQHTRGDNASPLIYACAYSDFLSIDRDQFDIVGVTGNSMGWYIALACAGALDAMGGLEVVNTMGTLMQEHLIGGQLIYPFTDENWVPIPGQRDAILSTMRDIDALPDHTLDVSIDLGGMLVLAGNEAGLSAFEKRMPRLRERFPMRLPNHAGFHTALQDPVAELGRAALPQSLFQQPTLPLIDGRGALWHPKATDLTALRDYTLGHQVVASYDLTAAIRTAARELMPDVFIILGPGTTLGGAVAQSLILSGWRGWSDKASFQASEAETKRLLWGTPEPKA
ncbi:[acyl-carrier-protein] S-malonyltransferase [Shimia gijangensis]|uniref:[acyl-carrier-protein] S-malonyltransferase n=1 Tax=Shimia gijangensis TaxID=1470563 RepID=A0A1M6GM94_9RHOB|nr:ACP S-malonyltransferase [Shimia gijangensis]SHJ11035.1 [acyl-carrier-protein] S-malonyltransferase [Shimia gijangensis]